MMEVAMNNSFITSLFPFIFLILTLPFYPRAHAATDMPAEIEKTFDFGTRIEHTVAVQKGISPRFHAIEPAARSRGVSTGFSVRT
jgi:hypothetical protein